MSEPRRLRLVKTDEETLSRVYVVVWTQYAHPGTPRVVGELLDLGGEVASPSVTAEVLRRDEMLAEPALARALRDWEQRDDALFARETAAAGRRRALISRAMHPSALGARERERWLPL